MQFSRVFVTGGAGYCGTILIPQLLDLGYEVTVYDALYFGNYLPEHPRLRVIPGDIRDAARLADLIPGHQAFVHLACISNDASFELDEALSTSINLHAFEPMVVAAKRAGVRRFIYASSSSVYGVSEARNVTEDHPLVPLSLYNKYKGMCEPLLLKHTDENFVGVIFRPATVCGYSPRLRLDLSVNILTNHAITNNKITVFGGSQLRPNLHVQDYADLVKLLLDAPDEKIANQIFNCGYQNMSMMEIAQLVKRIVEREFPEKGEIGVMTTPSDDLRSYHINSDKIARVLSFVPQHSIEEAVGDLCEAFRRGKVPSAMEDERYYNIRTMKKRKIA
jgi:nucleoside-diphosphate-sugar epimerase